MSHKRKRDETPFRNDFRNDATSPSSAESDPNKPKHNSNGTSAESNTFTSPPTMVNKAKDIYAYNCPPSVGDHEDSKEGVLSDERPRIGAIYEKLKVHEQPTRERLKELSKKDPTFHVGREIADSVHVLKIISSAKPVYIDIAGEKADRGATLLQEGKKLVAEAQQYLLRSRL